MIHVCTFFILLSKIKKEKGLHSVLKLFREQNPIFLNLCNHQEVVVKIFYIFRFYLLKSSRPFVFFNTFGCVQIQGLHP